MQGQQKKEANNPQQILNMRSQGINAVDLFHIKEKVRNHEDHNSELTNEISKFTKVVDDKTVKLLDRPIDYQGSIIGYDVLSKNIDIIACKNTSDYLLEMMRGIGIESREIIADIIELRKLLEVKQFEDNPTITL